MWPLDIDCRTRIWLPISRKPAGRAEGPFSRLTAHLLNTIDRSLSLSLSLSLSSLLSLQISPWPKCQHTHPCTQWFPISGHWPTGEQLVGQLSEEMKDKTVQAEERECSVCKETTDGNMILTLCRPISVFSSWKAQSWPSYSKINISTTTSATTTIKTPLEGLLIALGTSK